MPSSLLPACLSDASLSVLANKHASATAAEDIQLVAQVSSPGDFVVVVVVVVNAAEASGSAVQQYGFLRVMRRDSALRAWTLPP